MVGELAERGSYPASSHPVMEWSVMMLPLPHISRTPGYDAHTKPITQLHKHGKTAAQLQHHKYRVKRLGGTRTMFLMVVTSVDFINE